MVMECRMYRDPLLALISLENESCAGCLHKQRDWGKDYCDLAKRFGHKCKSYDDGEVKNGKR